MHTMKKLALALALTISSSAAYAEGDVAAGEKVFKKCKACHVADAEKNRVGPYLLGVVGRDVAAVESYGKKYSKAMKAYAKNDDDTARVWDEATLTEFLAAPRKVVKGTKMSFPGLKKEEDIVNVIAFLKAQTAE